MIGGYVGSEMSILLDLGIAECGVILIAGCYLSVMNTFLGVLYDIKRY